MLPAVVRRFVDPHHGTEHFQLPDGRSSGIDAKSRIRNEHVEAGVLEAEEHLVPSGGLVVAPQQCESFEAWLQPAESNFAAPDADTPQAARTKSFPCEKADVPFLRPILDFRCTDLPLHALDPAPPRDDRLHAGDQLDGLLRRERGVAARSPLPVEGGAGQWRSGRYSPLTTEEAVELIARVKAIVPRWCRIQRVQREIGAPEIQDGPKKGDIRLLARERLRASGRRCVCVRCREVGFRGIEPRPEALTLLRCDYVSSGGHEVFLSIEDPGLEVLVAYARLRIDTAGATVRELKVFGPMVRIHEAAHDRWQHRGFGRRLMQECERLAKDGFGARSVRVTAGVGVRGYYRNLGYELRAPYMVKPL